MCDNCDHGKEIMEKFKEDLLFALVVAGFVIFLLIVYLNSGRIIKEYKFNIECTQKIEQAANAASIEIADEKISEAISYLKKNNITSGNTSFIVRMPKNDVSYWYKNLLSIKEELESSYNSSSIEKGNLLLRLNNLLLDRDGKVAGLSNILYILYDFMNEESLQKKFEEEAKNLDELVKVNDQVADDFANLFKAVVNS